MQTSARGFFESFDTAELRDYLLDAYERHSPANFADISPEDHLASMKKHIYVDLTVHNNNKTVSHEMWAIAALHSQFKRQFNAAARMPEALGAAVCHNPVFMDAFWELRAAQNLPQLMRA